MSSHTYWWMAYYHFARSHESLRVKLDEPLARKGKQLPMKYKKITPATLAPRWRATQVQGWLLGSPQGSGQSWN